MADLTFDLEYDGPALEAHEMDVRDLAPALISMADLFQELNRTLFPVDPPLSVNVRATSEGSFLVQLKLIYDATVSTLAGDEATAAANLSALLGIIGGVVVYLRHKFRSTPVDEKPADEPGLIRVTFDDGTVIEIPQLALAASRNVNIQRSLAEVVRPLANPGVEVVRIARDTVTIAEIEKPDAQAFGPVEALSQQTLRTGEREAFLTIHTAGFQTNRWRFSDGLSLFFAPISDPEFIRQLNSGQLRIGKLDVLHCRIREIQWRDATGLHTQVEVLQVLEVLPYDPDSQGRLELPE